MQTGVQLGQNLLRRHGDDRAWPEDGRRPVFAQKLVIRSRDDAADDAHDVRTAQLGQLFNQSREQRLVPGCQRAEAHDVHVVFHGLAGRFFRCLEQRAGPCDRRPAPPSWLRTPFPSERQDVNLLVEGIVALEQQTMTAVDGNRIAEGDAGVADLRVAFRFRVNSEDKCRLFI